VKFPDLPVHEVLPQLREALTAGSGAVLVAPPGAGKTTVVPLALLDEPWLEGRRIIVLEPRRLAARAAAHRMSQLLGSDIGSIVGYRMRRDTRVGRHTRIEVVTEGILTRMLNRDPTLDGVGLLIFDEFHERSLNADLGLALALNSQRLVRPDLRILITSATLAVDAVARLLGGAAVVSSEGRVHSVDIRYLPRRRDSRIEDHVASSVELALRDSEGDLLVFLPGEGEIRRTVERIRVADNADVLPLYGNLSFEAQDRAIAPSLSGRRKVVLATSIAESSLTIQGVRCVIDAGLARVPRFSPRSGMTELATVRVSRASADQRAGRAGREAPGTCWRLWAAEEQSHLLPFAPAEIVEADLAPLVLELASAGISDPADLSWLDAPAPSRVMQARQLLTWLGALGADGRLSRHGARLTELGTHPRLAHMLVSANADGRGALACDLAALLESRDVVRSEREASDADLRVRVELLNEWRTSGRVPSEVGGLSVSRESVVRAAEESRAWRRQLGVSPDEPADCESAGVVLALAFPDRVAQRRGADGSRFVMRSGAGAVLRDSPSLVSAEFLAIALTDGRTPESSVFLAAPLELSDIRTIFGHQIETEESVHWDESIGAVSAARRQRLGALTLRSVPVRDADPERVFSVLVQAIRASNLTLLNLGRVAELRARIAFLRLHDPTWPDLSDAAITESLDTWLHPALGDVRSEAGLARVDLTAAIVARLNWAQRSRLDALAPTHFVAPTGSRLPIDYTEPPAPVVRVRLQEMFGLVDHPRVMDGRVPILLHLLSPAHRPVQITGDLRSFWTASYREVRKDLRGRYPRHHWPEDPIGAEPTRRARRRGE
jgi:ATP-dependent helicase HrpB